MAEFGGHFRNPVWRAFSDVEALNVSRSVAKSPDLDHLGPVLAASHRPGRPLRRQDLKTLLHSFVLAASRGARMLLNCYLVIDFDRLKKNRRVIW